MNKCMLVHAYSLLKSCSRDALTTPRSHDIVLSTRDVPASVLSTRDVPASVLSTRDVPASVSSVREVPARSPRASRALARSPRASRAVPSAGDPPVTLSSARESCSVLGRKCVFPDDGHSFDLIVQTIYCVYTDNKGRTSHLHR